MRSSKLLRGTISRLAMSSAGAAIFAKCATTGDESIIPKTYCQSTGPKSQYQELSRTFVADAVEVASPSVVNIHVRGRMGEGSGSGFVISKDGLCVTNAHVVMHDRNALLNITLWDGAKFHGKVHSLDEMSDIALVKIEIPENHSHVELPPAKIGVSSQLRAGEFVVALGAPLRLSNTVTLGIVSSVARYGVDLFSALAVRGGSEYARTAFIQTDAAITRGNSGGPLVNLDGEVIGINTLSAQGVQGLSFAIPSDAAMAVVEQLKAHGRVARPHLGITMQDVMRAPRSTRRGRADAPMPTEVMVRVRSVEKGSPAARAGLEAGCTILKIDGRPIRSVRDVYRIGLTVGRHYTFQIQTPEGSEKTLTLTPEAAPSSGSVQEQRRWWP